MGTEKKYCDVCGTSLFERNNYYYGKLMTVRDFFDEQRYFNEKRWLINRMIHGSGVVCGLNVCSEGTDIYVEPGLAIDCCGREIWVPEKCKIALPSEAPDTYKDSKCITENKYIICLSYQEIKTEQVKLPPISCEEKEKYEYNRIRDSYKIEVKKYETETDSSKKDSDICPLDYKREPYKQYLCREDFYHYYLCQRLKEPCPECHIPECLILGIIKVSYQNIWIDPCYKRKLVYTNPMLYDLIYCLHGDLPHIKEISWSDAHKQCISWDDFADIVHDGLVVDFDTLMDPKTLNKHTFLVATFTVERTTGYRQMNYIPGRIKACEYDCNGKQATRAKFVFDCDWKNDEVAGKNSGIKYGADFEIILRGSSILGCNGKALDGDYIGNLPSGNGVQGGDFVSWFSVQKRDDDWKCKHTWTRESETD
jgi:hypothetical protein